MTTSLRIAHSWPLWLAATFMRAQESPADPLAVIATAELRLAKGQAEDAVLLLWEAEALVRALPSGVVRDAATASLLTLMPKADPLQAERAALAATAGKRLVEVALAYKQRKWYGLAADRLRIAAHFDPAAAEKELQALPPTRMPAPALATAPATTASVSLLPDGKVSSSSAGWEKTGDTLVGPRSIPTTASGYYLFAQQHTDCEIHFEVRIGPGTGGGGIMFGAASTAECYLLSVYQTGPGDVALLLGRSTGGRAEHLRQLDDKNRAGDNYHAVTLRVRGAEIDAEVDGGAHMVCTLPTTASGCIGLYAPGSDAPAQPLVFRNLTVTTLPPADAAADARSPNAAEEQQAIFEDVRQSERLLADKKTEEEGILLLRRTWARVRRLPTGVLRKNLDASIAQQLHKADPVHARRTKAGTDVGALLAGLAGRHRAAGRLLCARGLLQEACDFDPAHAGALETVRNEIAAAEAEAAAARAAELQPPAIVGDLVEVWFGGGKPLHHGDKSWHVSPAAAVAELSDTRWSGLFPVQEHVGGRLRVHIRLPRAGAAAGFLFDARGNNDCGFCCLVRVQQQLFLELHRYQLGKWQRLATQRVPLPAWRLEGWLLLEFDASPAGVVARAFDVQVGVERSKLGPLGPIGLGASDSGEGAVAIDLRGLAVIE